MGVPFNEPEGSAAPSGTSHPGADEPPASDGSSSGDASEERELEENAWYSTDASDEWEDPSEGGVLTLVLRAAEHGAEAELSQLLASGLSVPVDTPGPDSDTALHMAALYGHLGCARVLLEHGHSANIADDDGALPVHDAAAGGFLELVQLLLDRNPEGINAADNDGDTPLHNAARGGAMDVVTLLLEQGADPAARNADFKAPAGLAVQGSDMFAVLQEALDRADAAAAAVEASPGDEAAAADAV